jgi:hypothetical protein
MGILAAEFIWARNLLKKVKSRFQKKRRRLKWMREIFTGLKR